MPNDLEIDEVDPSVGFLYKTMLERDPKKRRVKPVQRHLIQTDFGGLDDSEDDSDFDVQKHHKGSDDSEAGEESEKEAGNVVDEEEEESAEEESDSESDDSNDDGDMGSEEENSTAMLNAVNSDSEEDEDYIPMKKKKKLDTGTPKPHTAEPVVAEMEAISNIPDSSLKHKAIRILICCVCLGEISQEDDEIVECDNCGVSVHEGCYGISDNHSSSSTVSSASTEPWFCDACKAGNKPHCELCPNTGGIFKETDAGKWVHLVCALYTPGVAFGDVDKLSPVTLFEMPYSKWGAKECTLCEDVRFSRTGVCISCDAGMCRSYFHVTCAQKEGLLSEAAPEEVMDIADPFFAYCKMHADKNMARAKRRNWLAIQSRVKRHIEKIIEDEEERTRFNRKLERHKRKYLEAKAKRPPSWVPTHKLIRYLTSSPSAVKKMQRKAELMGIITHVPHTSIEKQEMRKKSHIAPALSMQFISYYLERNVRIENIKNSEKELIAQNNKLQQQEKILRSQYDQLTFDVEKLKDSTNKSRKEGENIWSILEEIAGNTLTTPEIFRPRRLPKTQTKMDTPKSPPTVIHYCGICNKSHAQHLLAKCDNCHKYYHLACLDPPLTRMPKKTKLQGWQCSECIGSSSEDQEEKSVNPDAPRQLREKAKLKEPFTYTLENYQFSFRKKERKNKPKSQKKVKKRPLDVIDLTEESIEKSIKTEVKTEVPTPVKMPAPKKPKLKEQDETTMCCVCNKPGSASNVVRCDECLQSYHFHCLDPPLKKTPKQRGYTWHCAECDPTEESGEDLGDSDLETKSNVSEIKEFNGLASFTGGEYKYQFLQREAAGDNPWKNRVKVILRGKEPRESKCLQGQSTFEKRLASN
ncbi:hypothetical protein ScPMuIL_013132 [Solemya velum]